MREHPVEVQVAAAASAVWADAIPTIALQALWGRGDVAPVYAIVGLYPPAKRPFWQAWFAAIDPESDSARVEKAALTALRGAQDEATQVPVLALVPLGRAAVDKLARRVAGRDGRTVLAARAGESVRDFEDYEPLGKLVAAVRAVALAERGRLDEANAALTTALEGVYDHKSEAALILAVRRLDAWEQASDKPWSSPSPQWAAFVAGQVDLDAAERFLGRSKYASLCAAATLGAGRPAEAWRESLPCSEERMEELWIEGLIDGEERWALRFGDLLARSQECRDIEGLVFAACVEAHARARSFADRLLSGPASRDEEKIAQRARKLLAIAEEAAAEGPASRRIRRMLLPARRLAEMGGTAEVGAAVAALERRWGPANRWGPEDRWGRAATAAETVELLACAEGRSLDALELDGRDSELPIAARVQLCVALARERHVEELREPLERLLAGPLEPEQVARLVPAMLAADPTTKEAIELASARALAALPDTAEAARAWLDRQAAAASRASRRRGE